VTDERALRQAADLAIEYLRDLPERPVGPIGALDQLRAGFDGDVPEDGADASRVVEDLVRAAEPGLVASAGPRYFGFVIGGSLPATVASQWLSAAWDQNAFSYATSAAAAVAEEVAARWLLDVLHLPATASVGMVTGAMMANFTCLAAARHAVLARVGWDVEANGLFGAPPIDVFVGAEAHVTVFAALRMLGLGAERVHIVPADDQGRMTASALREAIAQTTGPAIVCAQAGNVNSGAFDPFDEIGEASSAVRAWLHVDGAFGLWAAASPALRDLVSGVERADSWALDAHKWLNVPYDSGVAIVASPEAHRATMALRAAYLIRSPGDPRDNNEYVPESSRRARGFDLWVALRVLGRSGIAEMIERGCEQARRMADRLTAGDGVHILNDVVLNQVLVGFDRPDRPGDTHAADDHTRAVIDAVQRDGTCWLGGTTWQGRAAMRISVSNWMTTDHDIDVSAEAILRCVREVAARDLAIA